MAKSKRDYQIAIRDSIAQYPDAALLYQVSDPLILAQLDAIATMFAMLDAQTELASNEPFLKVRDSAILADAALKGILPQARPARVSILVKNNSQAEYTLQQGRILLDASGKLYVADSSATIPAGGSATIQAVQRVVREQPYTVTQTEPFLAVEVLPAQEGRSIAGISVVRSDGQVFTYHPDFTNVAPGDFIYHVETDEYRRLFVRFGYRNVVGYQPDNGEQYVITVIECDGDVRPELESPFTLEHTLSTQESQVSFAMAALVTEGALPADIATLRELARYPSIYDNNAVFLGEFDFLIRRNITDLMFLSVWNEQIEERARGASVDNINKLFVTVSPADGGGGAQTQLKRDIEKLIVTADDSYTVQFVPAVTRLINIEIDAFVAIVNDPAVVASQIRASVLAEYGIDAPSVRRGMVIPQYKRLYDRIRGEVPAVADLAADMRINILPDSVTAKPEHYRYASESSVVVRVQQAVGPNSNWGS